MKEKLTNYKNSIASINFVFYFISVLDYIWEAY